MDPLAEFLLAGSAAPAARGRGAKFVPKGKSKAQPRRDLSASEHQTSSKDGKNEHVASSSTSTDTEGISQNECHDAPLVDAQPSTITLSEVESVSDFTNLPKSACEKDLVASEVDPNTNIIPETNLSNGSTQPVAPANVVENILSSVVVPPTTCSTIGTMEEPPKNGKGDSFQAESVEFELHPFSNNLPDRGTSTARKLQPKFKPRKPAIVSASSNVMIGRCVELPKSCTNEVQSSQSNDNGSGGLKQSTNLPVTTSKIPTTTDLSSNGASFGKSAGESADIFSGLESLDDSLAQAATDTGKPVDDVLDYQSKSSKDTTSEIPVQEELTKAADSPTLADLLQADVIGEKEDANGSKKDGTRLSSLRKGKRFSIASAEDKGVKTSRQLKKQAARKPVNNSVNEEEDDLDPPYNPNRDELEENDDESEVDDSPKKKTKSTSSTKKSVAKNGKTSQKRKKTADEDLENTTKEPPKKKFSHSTRRKKRCVDKDLLDVPDDELQTLPLKDIILLAEYKERLAKKEAATLKTPSTNQSGEDSFHEAGANNSEEEYFGSEDDREPGDDGQASEDIPMAPSLFNYQSFMDKQPRGKWSKQDNELFYEGVRQFGTDFSMIQQLFPDRTRHQIKLKYKKEERQHPLELADAINNRATDHTYFKTVIERLKQAAAKADQDFMTGEEVEDLTTEANDEDAPTEQDEVAKTEQEAIVKDQEDSASIHSPEASGGDGDGDGDDDDDGWLNYKAV